MFFPFSENSEETVGALGESRIIGNIRRAFAKVSPPAPRGMGDDCAVLPAVPEKTPAGTHLSRLVTTDSVIFSKHFDERVSPRDAGKNSFAAT